MNERPTPETEAAFERGDFNNQFRSINFARKLERERDEARLFAKQLTDTYLEFSGELQAQIAEMREVIKEAYSTLSFMNDLHSDGASECSNKTLAKLKPFLT